MLPSVAFIDRTSKRHEMTDLQKEFLAALEKYPIEWQFEVDKGDLKGVSRENGAPMVSASAWQFGLLYLNLCVGVSPETAPAVFEILRRAAREMRDTLKTEAANVPA